MGEDASADLFKYPLFGTVLSNEDEKSSGEESWESIKKKKVDAIVELAYDSDGPVFIYCEKIRPSNNIHRVSMKDLQDGFTRFNDGNAFQVECGKKLKIKDIHKKPTVCCVTGENNAKANIKIKTILNCSKNKSGGP